MEKGGREEEGEEEEGGERVVSESSEKARKGNAGTMVTWLAGCAEPAGAKEKPQGQNTGLFLSGISHFEEETIIV